MNRKKIIAVSVFAVAMIAIIGAYATVNSNKNNKDEKAENVALQISAEADFTENGDLIEDLVELASAGVIKGTVKNIHSFCDDTGTIYSDYTLKIDEAYAGELQEGAEIIVSNFGGRVDVKEYKKFQTDPKALEGLNDQESGIVEYTFGGAWLPQENESYIWYLEKNEHDGEVSYHPVNAYQGIFEINKGVAERHEQEEGEDYIESMKVSEMESEVERISDELDDQVLSDKELAELALNDMDDIEQSTIVDKENPKIEHIEFDEDPRFGAKDDADITLVGKKIAKVSFETTVDNTLGPIVLYLDAKTGEVYGYAYRD